jgi:hypothetical protein
MERDYKEADWEGCLPSEIADEIGECLVYEALQRIEEASKTERIRRNSVYQAFVNIGRVKNIWGERFDELWDDVFKMPERNYSMKIFLMQNFGNWQKRGEGKANFWRYPKKWGEIALVMVLWQRQLCRRLLGLFAMWKVLAGRFGRNKVGKGEQGREE